jgi:hypothetical protein
LWCRSTLHTTPGCTGTSGLSMRPERHRSSTRPGPNGGIEPIAPSLGRAARLRPPVQPLPWFRAPISRPVSTRLRLSPRHLRRAPAFPSVPSTNVWPASPLRYLQRTEV